VNIQTANNRDVDRNLAATETPSTSTVYGLVQIDVNSSEKYRLLYFTTYNNL